MTFVKRKDDMIATCPSQDQLRSLSLGELSEEKSDALIIHIERCGSCRTELGSLDDSADTFIQTLRGAQDPLENEPDFDDEQEQRIASTRALAALALAEREGSTDSTVPKVIGEYEIVRQLGHGGMGHVYLGQHTKLGRKVAIKFLANHRRWDRTMHERFAAEMRTIGGLDHANIVSAHDAREVDGTAVLVTEFIDGLDVSDIIRRSGRLSLANAAAIVTEVCQALRYCDQQGIVHRDVKPSNIMIAKDGTVKLLDLGLARLQDANSQEEFTATGQAIGTADYVAPEQINDGKNVDLRTDIYGLGCTLYKMLSGVAPFGNQQYATAFAKMNAHISDAPQRIEELCHDLPKPVSNLIHQMLEKSPQNRPQNMDEVIRGLDSFEEGADLSTLVAKALASDPPIAKAASTAVEPKKFSAVQPSFASRIPWTPMIAAGLAAFLFGMWLGVVITVKKPDGTMAKVVIPDGATAIIDEEGNIEIQLGDQTHRIAKEQVERKPQPAAVRGAEGEIEWTNFVIRGPRPGELFVYEKGADSSSDRIIYQIDKTSPLFNRLENRDLVDVQAYPRGRTEGSVLFSKAAVVQVSKTTDTQRISLKVASNQKERISELMKEGASLFVQFHEPKRQTLVDTVNIDGAWRCLVKRFFSVTSTEDGDDCYLFHRGMFVQIHNKKLLTTAQFEIGLNSTLVSKNHDTSHQASEGKGLYRFLDSGKLDIGFNENGQVPKSIEKADVFLRLERVVTPRSDAEKLALELIESATKAEKKIEFVIIDQKTSEKMLPAVITNQDVLSAEVDVQGDSDKSVSIRLKLTAGGGERLRRLTTSNIGNKLLVAVDGKEICSPIIRDAIGSECSITGDFTLEEAQVIADSIVPRMNLDGMDLEGEAMRAASRANLKKLGAGMLEYEAEFKTLPASALIVKDHPVSWRVLILPAIGQVDLFNEYRSDEPWDSEHNQKLLGKMPAEFRHPSAPKDSTTTNYIGLAGTGTAMGVEKGVAVNQITDGTSNTLMLVESKTDIPWTKPEDFLCDDTFANALGSIRPFEKNIIQASLVDGSAVTLDRTKINQDNWNGITYRGDGKVFFIDQLIHGGSPARHEKKSYK